MRGITARCYGGRGARAGVANGARRCGHGGQWQRGDHAAGTCPRVLFTCTPSDGDGRGRIVTSPARPRMTSRHGRGRRARAARSPPAPAPCLPRRRCRQSMTLSLHLGASCVSMTAITNDAWPQTPHTMHSDLLRDSRRKESV